jgi:lipid A 3-O-deacylase
MQPRRWSRVSVLASALAIIVLCWRPAVANELVAPQWSPQLLDPYRFELRVGAFAHGVGSIESGTAAINGEFVFPRFHFGQGEWWAFLVPRPHLGVMANVSGLTSYAYAGGLWTIPITRRFFVEGFFGGAVADGTKVGSFTQVALGCNPLFHVGGSVGFSLTENWHVIGTFDHISNGNEVFGTNCSRNQGLNNYGARLSYSFRP